MAGRLKTLLRAQQGSATTQRNTQQERLLHVASPRECNTQQLGVRELRSGRLAANAEHFTFSPPADAANDAEALLERAGIMAEGNGWDHATALQEARWQADRERAWRAFLRNAERFLAAPRQDWVGMLAQYQAEAAARYGGATARDMAGSLRKWIEAKPGQIQ